MVPANWLLPPPVRVRSKPLRFTTLPTGATTVVPTPGAWIAGMETARFSWTSEPTWSLLVPGLKYSSAAEAAPLGA